MDKSFDLPVLQHPFTAMICGATSSGKTVLTRSILKEYKTTTSISKEPLNVIYCYGAYQSLFERKIPKVNITYHEGLITAEGIEEIKPDMIIIDDLMTELSNNPELSALFTKKSHHLNISVIFITQNIFPQGKEMRNVSLNTTYIFLMKAIRDKSQIVRFAAQYAPKKTQEFMAAFEDATKEPYSYLLIDMSRTCPEELRLRTNVDHRVKDQHIVCYKIN